MRRKERKMDKKVHEELAKICEMLATYDKQTPKQKEKLLKYAKVFRALGGLNKKIKSKEDKTMGKKLTDQETRIRKVAKVISLIQKFEKVHGQDIVEAACYRYKMANVDKRRAEAKIAAMEKELSDAKRRLK